MAGGNLQVEVVSHEGRLWHGAAASVQVPAVDGQLGILPGRQPLLAMLGSGSVVVLTDGGRPTRVDVDGGIVSVDSDFVTVVADHATLH
ncbi:F0F1 ATP synthase subunit epsilon [Actinomyces sp. B33]|uniref:F0F1 ATP synthase subunit epsilon n=1 Tax=Actinomyces sp. B33 TaxID=2942131 RepID=UPI00234143BB|nr:F0F1 ATP synthase subunit epsilon [Actinomyces sp. B33]MDC4232860.1 F0F1 ATP synthase subunit epsilon [Actinomyces sp. B33]